MHLEVPIELNQRAGSMAEVVVVEYAPLAITELRFTLNNPYALRWPAFDHQQWVGRH
jgi:hypothetical protein